MAIDRVTLNLNARGTVGERRVQASASILRIDHRDWLNTDVFVDTGAHITVVPPAIWRGASSTERLISFIPRHEQAEITVQGSVARVDVGQICLAIMDHSRRSTPTWIPAMLCYEAYFSNHVLLGIEGILAGGTLHCDWPRNTGYVECPCGE